MVKESGVRAIQTTAAAVDEAYGFVIAQADNKCDRELIQLSYHNGTNSNACIPAYYLVAPQAPTEADGSYNMTTVIGYQVLLAPAAGHIAEAQGLSWPSHAKANLAARAIIPSGYLLIAAPIDADMNGTIIYRCMTRDILDA